MWAPKRGIGSASRKHRAARRSRDRYRAVDENRSLSVGSEGNAAESRVAIVDELDVESYFQIGTSLVIGFIRKGRIRVRHVGRAGPATLVDPEQDTGETDPGCFRLVAGDRLAGLVLIWD